MRYKCKLNILVFKSHCNTLGEKYSSSKIKRVLKYKNNFISFIETLII